MLKNIFKPKNQKSLDMLLRDRIHYACGKNVLDGWLNVDGFDVSYPDGSIDPKQAENIFHCDLSKPHPFPDNHFKFGYAEDFLEHLTQADSIVFLKDCHRCFAPGGVFRLSFPGLYGILCWHFKVKTRAEAEQGVRDAYTSWHHEHFFSPESISMVAKALGWSKTEVCPFGVSTHPELHNLETRPEQRELNLVVELTK